MPRVLILGAWHMRNLVIVTFLGRAMAQAVSRWPLTAEARVNPCGICGGQSGTGAGFLRVLRFPLQIYHSTIAPYSSITAP
jgi:hypothetical protein